MLEKDIENLIAKYPGEFLNNQNLELVGQQVKLDKYFADIIFKDNAKNKMIIIEVKKGILSRDAIPQIMDYYGILKPQQQNSIIELFVVANTIPKERSAFLSEWGIKFIEIPVSKIIEIAQKHSYEFLDVDRPEVVKKYQQLTHDINNDISAQKAGLGFSRLTPKGLIF